MTKKKEVKTATVMGRPSKYSPIFCETVIALMSEGASKTEVAAELNIAWDTLHEWEKNFPEFSDAIKRGSKLSEGWWEKKARENLVSYKDGPTINASLWYMNMKNRFGWKDKQEVEVTVDISDKLREFLTEP